jgi:sulfate adenylyltransferase subunit 1 (EFTu-like GTPase family)
MLVMLRDKTHGNLDSEENTLLDRILHDVRMAFVEQVKKHGS